jgi:hypothetical protein
LVIVIQSYARSPALMKNFGERALKSLNIQAADVLLLGWHNRRPPARLLDQALALKDQGKFRFPFPELAQEGIFDVFHLRYSAAHRGADALKVYT